MAIVYLIGYRATGKTTIGKMLAERLGYRFFDLDTCLCQRQGQSVAEIVAGGGWETFRDLEQQILRDITDEAGKDAVIATGGGIILAEENRRFMREHGLVIWLTAPPKVLEQRLRADPAGEYRPSLTGEDMIDEIAAVLFERLPLYAACAHHRMDTVACREDVCAALAARVQSGIPGEDV